MQLIMTANNQSPIPPIHFVLVNDNSYNTIFSYIIDWLCNKAEFVFGEKEYQELIEKGFCFLNNEKCDYFNQCTKKDDKIRYCHAKNEIKIELRPSMEEREK